MPITDTYDDLGVAIKVSESTSEVDDLGVPIKIKTTESVSENLPQPSVSGAPSISTGETITSTQGISAAKIQKPVISTGVKTTLDYFKDRTKDKLLKEDVFDPEKNPSAERYTNSYFDNLSKHGYSQAQINDLKEWSKDIIGAKQVIEPLDERIKKNPLDKQAPYLKGLALTKIGDYNEAIKSFQKSAEIPDAVQEMATQESGGKLATAPTTNGDNFYGMGYAFQKAGKEKEAIINYQMAIEDNPEQNKIATQNSYTALSDILWKMGDKEGSKQLRQAAAAVASKIHEENSFGIQNQIYDEDEKRKQQQRDDVVGLADFLIGGNVSKEQVANFGSAGQIAARVLSPAYNATDLYDKVKTDFTEGASDLKESLINKLQGKDELTENIRALNGVTKMAFGVITAMNPLTMTAFNVGTETAQATSPEDFIKWALSAPSAAMDSLVTPDQQSELQKQFKNAGDVIWNLVLFHLAGKGLKKEGEIIKKKADNNEPLTGEETSQVIEAIKEATPEYVNKAVKKVATENAAPEIQNPDEAYNALKAKQKTLDAAISNLEIPIDVKNTLSIKLDGVNKELGKKVEELTKVQSEQAANDAEIHDLDNKITAHEEAIKSDKSLEEFLTPEIEKLKSQKDKLIQTNENKTQAEIEAKKQAEAKAEELVLNKPEVKTDVVLSKQPLVSSISERGKAIDEKINSSNQIADKDLRSQKLKEIFDSKEYKDYVSDLENSLPKESTVSDFKNQATEEQKNEMTEYEKLILKKNGLNPEEGYKPYKLTKEENVRFDELNSKYRDIYFKNLKPQENAIKKGEIQTSNQPEYSGTAQIGTDKEPSGSNSLQPSGEIQKKEKIADDRIGYESFDMGDGRTSTDILVDGKRVGTISLSDVGNERIIKGIEIDKDFQNKGLAEKLYKQAIDQAKKEGKEGIVSGATPIVKESKLFIDKIISGLETKDLGEGKQLLTGLKEPVKESQLSGIKKELVPSEKIESTDIEKRSTEDVLKIGKDLVDSGQINPKSIVDSINEKPRALQPNEVSSLVYYKAKLDRSFDDIIDGIEKAKEAGDINRETLLRTQLEGLNKDLDAYHEMSVKTAYEQSLAFRLRQMLLDSEYNLKTQERKYKEINNGEITPEVEARFKEYDEQLKEVNKKIRDLERLREEDAGKTKDLNAEKESEEAVREERKKKRSVTKEKILGERKIIVDSIKEKLKQSRTGQSGLTAVPIPYAKELAVIAPDVAKLMRNYAQEGIVTLDGFVDNIHNDIKDLIDGVTKQDVRDIIAGNYKEPKKRSEINQAISDIRREAKLITRLEALMEGEAILKPEKQKILDSEEIAKLKKEIGEHNITRLSQLKSRYESEIKKYEEKLNKGDFEKPIQKEKPLYDSEMKSLEIERNKIKEKFDVEQEKARLANRPLSEKISDNFIDAVNLPKSLMASADLSAPLRQGAVLSFRHPVLASKAFAEMIRHAFSEQKSIEWLNQLRASDIYSDIKKSDLYVSEPTARLTAKEEQFVSNIAKKIPVLGKIIAGSERAYTGYLNKLRVDTFSQFRDAVVKDGIKGDELNAELKSFADFVNNASGRGKLGKFEESAPLLNALFFSPRYVISRFNLLNPATYMALPKNARVEALKTVGSYIGIGSMVLAIAKASGAEVEDDSRSADFGKIKVGNTRYDIWAGFQQMVRLISTVASGEKKDAQGRIIELGKGYKSDTRLDVAGRFARSKLSPSAGVAADIMAGKDYSGQPITISDEILKNIIPLWSSDIQDLYKEHGLTGGTASALASFFGVGVQQYNPKDKKKNAKVLYKQKYE